MCVSPARTAFSARAGARRRIRRCASAWGSPKSIPARFDLLFERFVSPERNEPPDIDVDFEHERRDEVIQYIYAKYGRERAGLASAVTTYRARSAIRETAKVFGLSEDVVVALNSLSWGREDAKAEGRAEAAGLERDPNLMLSLEMAEQISGFPRHLTQHSGGFVITRDRLDEVAPIMNTGDGRPHRPSNGTRTISTRSAC